MENNPQEIPFILQNLKKIDFLSHLPPNRLEELAKKLVKITFDKGDYLLKEGHSGGAFFILTSGRLSVLAEGANGEEVQVGHLEPITYFGEIALLSKSERYASVRAEDDIVVYMLGKDAFNSFLLGIPEAKEALERVAEERKFETHHTLFPDRDGDFLKDKKGSFFSRIIGK